jgi:Carbohydrate binding domain
VTQLTTFLLFDDECAFSVNPNVVLTQAALNAAWVSMGSRTLAVSGIQQGRAYELAQVQAGTGSYSLRNDDEALNPVNTGSAYYPNVLPFRRFRTIAAWTTGGGWAGNVLNDTNASWGDTPMSANDASFEGGTIGDWTHGGTGAIPTLSNSATHAQDGTHALKCAFAAAPGTAAGAYLTIGVIPNQQVTVSAYVWLASPLTGATINVTGYGSGTTDSTTGSFARISQTFTPTTPTVVLSITFTGTGSGNAWIDAVQAQNAASPSTFGTTGPTMYADFTGYAERWPETWLRQG